MNKYKNDLICSSIFVVFGVAVLILAPLMTPSYKNDALGSGFFPKVIGACTVFVAALLGINSIIKIRRDKDSFREQYSIDLVSNLRVVLFCLVTVLAVYLVGAIHFLVGSLVLVILFLVLCGERKVSRYLIVCGCCIIAYLFFSKFLNVRI